MELASNYSILCEKMSEIESLKRKITLRKIIFLVASVITVGCAGMGIYQFGVLKNSSSRLYIELYSFTFIGSMISCVSLYELVCLNSDFKELEQEEARKKELEDVMKAWWEKYPQQRLEDQ